MNNFSYTITKEVFESIISGKKKIEIRLYNEKSSQINLGDTIDFHVLDDTRKIRVRVIGLLRYQTLNDLLKDFDTTDISDENYDSQTLAELLIKIFGQEEVLNHDILGIKFELIG